MLTFVISLIYLLNYARIERGKVKDADKRKELVCLSNFE